MQRSFVREKRKPGRRARQAARAAQAIRIAPARSNACRAWISVVRAARIARDLQQRAELRRLLQQFAQDRQDRRAAVVAQAGRRARQRAPRRIDDRAAHRERYAARRREGRRDMRLHVDGERVLRAMQRRLVLLADDRCADGRDRAARDARPDGVSCSAATSRALQPASVSTRPNGRRSRSRPRARRARRARSPAVPKLTMPAQPRAVASVSARSRRSARAAKTASTPSPRAMRASNAIPVTAMTGNEPVDCGATRYSPTVTRVVLSRFRLR